MFGQMGNTDTEAISLFSEPSAPGCSYFVRRFKANVRYMQTLHDVKFYSAVGPAERTLTRRVVLHGFGLSRGID